MKTNFLRNSIVLALLFYMGLESADAQDCSAFYPFSEGVYAEYTSYNKRGKAEATATYSVENVVVADGLETATISSDLLDENGEKITTVSYDIKCQDNKVAIGFKSLMNNDLLTQFQDVDIDVSGTDVDLPNDLSVGQSLPDADMKMTINTGGISMNMYIELLDRKVIGQESVTTPAGTFDCYVITYTSKIKMGLNRTGSAKQWLAKGVGLVKQEDYNKKGKLVSSGMLTKYTE